MLKSDYQFESKELESFYNHVATRRPNEQNRGGGFRLQDDGMNNNIISSEELDDKLNVLYFYQHEFLENGMWRQAKVVERTRQKIYIAASRKGITGMSIPSLERGKELVEGRLSRSMRTMCSMFNSILNGKPNEMARAFFAEAVSK